MRATRAWIPAGVIVVACAAASGDVRALADAPGARAERCAPLTIDPPSVRVAVGDVVTIRARGGGGDATLAIEGEAGGASISPGGTLEAGDHPAAFDVLAHDDACGATVKGRATVVPPLSVDPLLARVAASGTVRFAIHGGAGAAHARLLDDPRGATIRDDGTFTAPARAGRWRALVTDSGSSREVPLTIDVVGKLPPLRARETIVAAPAGAAIPLAWTGGSGAYDVRLTPPRGAHVERDSSGALRVALDADAPPSLDAVATDRVTGETARVRVEVAPPFGSPPMPHGTRTLRGDVATGDVNGDGLADLVVGHAERAAMGVDAGGVLVFYGRRDGGFGEKPDLVLEGERAGELFGASVVVRDVTGDGIDDVLAAAPGEVQGVDGGSVSVFRGGRGGVVASSVQAIAGEVAHGHFGAALLAGDVDGDGAPDLVVSAPGAPTGCGWGRAYVFRGGPNASGAFEAVPWQTIDLRDPIGDADVSPLTCAKQKNEAGASLALADMDGDGAVDLAVGAPSAAKGEGAIDVYRGARDGTLSVTPTWAVHLDHGLPATQAGLAAALDVVKDAGADVLVARGRAGGMWSFARGALGEPAPDDEAGSRVRVIMTKGARASYAGAVRGDAVVADLDGDGRDDYVVTDATTDAATRLLAFRVADLARAQPLTPFVDVVTSTAGDATGARVAAWTHGSSAAGLALFAPLRSTPVGPLVGAVDLVAPAPPAEIAARLAKRRSVALPAPAAGDRSGASVAFVRVGGALEGFVGAPGAAVAQRSSAGRFDRWTPGRSSPAPLVGEDAALLGATPPVPIDFDGDGTDEIAIADLASPRGLAADEIDPDGCLSRPEMAYGYGRVHIYSVTGDRFVERARVVAHTTPGDAAHGFGAALAAADVNGDRRGDLVIGRLDGGSIEVVLGRPFVAGKVIVACRADAGAEASLLYPREGVPFRSGEWWAALGARVASIGDVDRDGCDEVAFSRTQESSPRGVFVAFGYDAAGKRCRGHDRPLVMSLVSLDRDLRPFTKPLFGADMERGIVRTAGTAIGNGPADLTGDGVPDLVFGDDVLCDDTGSGGAVEILSGAFLASVCPNHVCPSNGPGVAAEGDSAVVALSLAGPRDRVVVRGGPFDRSFGASIALADFDGDRHVDLAVGAPSGSVDARSSGDVQVFRGPFPPERDPHAEPWMLVVGGEGEDGAFGSSIAMARDRDGAFLLVGSPRSSRGGAGVGLGAAYGFRLDGRGER